MNKYIFDWAENSEKILRSGKYTTKVNQFMEQAMFCRYLRDRGKDRGDTFSLWLKSFPLSVKRAHGDMEDIDYTFDRVWQYSERLQIFKHNEIVIYQEEIDFINSMEVLSWVKEYMLTMLCIYKYYGEEWCRYDRKIKTFCYSATSIKRERTENTAKITECINKYAPYELSIRSRGNTALAFKMLFAKDRGVEVGRIPNPRHVEQLFVLLTNEKRCTKCGRNFPYSSYTVKNILCPRCYKKERHRKQNSRKQHPTVKTYLMKRE